jgi:hypothetical protein
MTLMDIAGRDRNKRDPLLKMATGVLVLEDLTSVASLINCRKL